MTSSPHHRRHSLVPRVIILVVASLCVVAIVWFVILPQVWFARYEPEEGDILFQSLPRSSISIAIEGATDSPWSHCGIVARENGEWVVYEAYGRVQSIPLAEFWQRSRRHRFAVYRLREVDRPAISRILEEVKTYCGLPYDSRYEWDDEKIYCSELISKAYKSVTGKALGQMVRLGDLDWQPHEALIERLEGGAVPVHRLMLTPRDLASAPELELVRSHGVD